MHSKGEIKIDYFLYNSYTIIQPCNLSMNYLLANLLALLNKYQTDLYFLESCHQMTNDCLLISGFLPVFSLFLHVGSIELFCTSKRQNKNNSLFLCCKPFQILVNFQKSTNNFMSNHG